MSDAELWAKANEILKRTRGSDESVSVAWVHRFKKRHGLHRSQLRRAAAAAANEAADVAAEQALQVGDKRSAAVGAELELAPPKKRPALAASDAAAAASEAAAGHRAHFVSAEDVLLLTQVLAVQPWGFPYAMDGWQQVVQRLRADGSFRLEKTAGACQARVNLLLAHMRAGNMVALRKAGTEDEFDRKCALIREVAAQMEAHGGVHSADTLSSGLSVVAPVGVQDPVASVIMPDLAQERERIAQRRLELMERKLERELAAQKRHSEEQVSRLEKLHREQQKIQQEQHAQLLGTIQQQQAMMLELIKSLAPAPAPTSNQSQSL
ncbi:unnamed protein product [Phytophthora fragariaefolia]|uniref:Unnamed protein product n=1 Tax=Phytophthora fragariaefolia TaxID=1490495 RepID=A0A9W6X9I8_9STRA|nr:unnamed protein product [Phytophthora fragariaefolia]